MHAVVTQLIIRALLRRSVQEAGIPLERNADPTTIRQFNIQRIRRHRDGGWFCFQNRSIQSVHAKPLVTVPDAFQRGRVSKSVHAAEIEHCQPAQPDRANTLRETDRVGYARVVARHFPWTKSRCDTGQSATLSASIIPSRPKRSSVGILYRQTRIVLFFWGAVSLW